MLMYGGGRLVEVMLLMNVVIKSECCPLDWNVPSTKMVM